jgi:hypothetical protein
MVTFYKETHQAHYKFIKYITKLTEMRSVNHPDPQRISNINDVRNGLLLNLIAIVEFKRYVAFLPVSVHCCDDILYLKINRYRTYTWT